MNEIFQETVTKLEGLTGADRHLDGDIWWSLMSEEARAAFDPTGYVRDVIRREGSAGKGLASFFDSTRRPPSLLDHAPAFTRDASEVLLLIDRHLPGWRVAFERRTDGACLAWITEWNDDPSVPAIAKTIQASLLIAFLTVMRNRREEAALSTDRSIGPVASGERK